MYATGASTFCAIGATIGKFRFSPGFGRTLARYVRNGVGVHHAGMLPKYRRLVERLAQCFQDGRDPDALLHTVPTLLGRIKNRARSSEMEIGAEYGLSRYKVARILDACLESGLVRIEINTDAAIDMASLAILMGATFVARSFSGDKQQLVPLIKGAISHGGAAFIDVISPCVAFNNHPGSTKSYDYIREHNESVSRIDFITQRDEITAQAPPGQVVDVRQHDGSLLRLRTLPGPTADLLLGVRRHVLAAAEHGLAAVHVDLDVALDVPDTHHLVLHGPERGEDEI